MPTGPDARPKPYALRDLLRDLQAHRALGIENVYVVFGGQPRRVVSVFRDGEAEESVCLVVE